MKAGAMFVVTIVGSFYLGWSFGHNVFPKEVEKIVVVEKTVSQPTPQLLQRFMESPVEREKRWKRERAELEEYKRNEDARD